MAFYFVQGEECIRKKDPERTQMFRGTGFVSSKSIDILCLRRMCILVQAASLCLPKPVGASYEGGGETTKNNKEQTCRSLVDQRQVAMEMSFFFPLNVVSVIEGSKGEPIEELQAIILQKGEVFQVVWLSVAHGGCVVKPSNGAVGICFVF